MQKKRPIVRTYEMNLAETRYHAGEQEHLAVFKALKHFRPYVESGVQLTSITKYSLDVTPQPQMQMPSDKLLG